ncbi:hypothetical protein D915_010708, partial [Fasciola hepatica]
PFAISNVGISAISFSKPIYKFKVGHGSKKLNNVIGKIEIVNAESMGQIRYWMDDDLAHISRITVDEITGAVRLVSSVLPISFFVSVHAGIASDPGRTHARAIVQVHVTCHFGSDVWDTSQGWAAIHPTSAADLIQFRLREVNDDSTEDENSWLPPIQSPIQLRYEIGLTKFGCTQRSRVSCNATRNVQLESMALWKFGIGLKCSDHPLEEKSKFQSALRFLTQPPIQLSNVSQPPIITQSSTRE